MSVISQAPGKAPSSSSYPSDSHSQDDPKAHVKYLKTSYVWKRADSIVPRSFPDKLLNALARKTDPYDNKSIPVTEEAHLSFAEAIEHLAPYIPRVVRSEDAPIIRGVLEALEKNAPQIVSSLLADLPAQEKKEVLTACNWNGETVLTIWAQFADPENPAHQALFNLLIAEGANPFQRQICDGRLGDIPITLLIKRGCFEAAKTIFSSECYQKGTFSETKLLIIKEAFSKLLICWNDKSYVIRDSSEENASPVSMLFFLFSQLDDFLMKQKIPILNDLLLIAVKTGWPTTLFELFARAGADVNNNTSAQLRRTCLFFLVKQGDLEGVQFFSQRMRSVDDAIDRNGTTTTLQLAAKYGNTKICTYLLNCGADPSIRRGNTYSATEYALVNGHLNVVEVFLNKMPKLLESADLLVTAILEGQIPSAQFLIAQKINLGLENFSKLSPLYLAIMYGNKTLVELLINAGGEQAKNTLHLRNEYGRTPIEVAVICGKAEILEYLWEQGGSFTPEWLSNPLINNLSAEFVTFLLKNVPISNHVDVLFVNECVRYGVDLNIQNKETGETLLHYAVKKDDTKMITVLLENGADPNREDKSGATPLALELHKFVQENAGLFSSSPEPDKT